jgi:putative membrane protein
LESDGRLGRQSEITIPVSGASERRWHLTLLFGAGAVLIWSLIGCRDLFTWAMEIFPVLIGGAILIRAYPRFQFTTFTYILITIHAIILMIGGHYTYARMPLFDWLKDFFHLQRNYYDRLGHFAQGFIPAMIAREILLRTTPLKRGKLLFYLVLSTCMAITAWYELTEFAAAKMTGTAADDFLGTQGDPWDTQWDMTFCFIGALCALTVAAKVQDRFLRKLSA